MLKNYKFTFGKNRELHESQYNGICLESLLYDAVQGINLSIIEIFDFYFRFEKKSIQQEPEVFKPIQEFMFAKLKNLLYQEIEPHEILNPLGGKTHKKFYPSKLNRDRRSELSHINSLRQWGQLSHNEAFNHYYAANDNSPSVKTLEADMLFIKTRKKRLKKVEELLKKFYMEVKDPEELPSNDKFIDLKQKHEELKKVFNQLQDIYKDPRSLS